MPADKTFGYVYLILNKVNGKVYVGASMKPNERWASHRRQMVYGSEDKSDLHKDMRKHGFNNFVFTKIVKAKDEKELYKLEKKWIESMEARNPEQGYNRNACYYSVTKMQRIVRSINMHLSREKMYKEAQKKKRNKQRKKRH